MSLTAAGPWCNFSFFRTARAPPLSAAVHHHHHPANIITASSTTTTLLLLRTRTTCLVAAEVFAHPSFRHLFPPPQSPATQPPQLLLLRAMPCSGFASHHSLWRVVQRVIMMTLLLLLLLRNTGHVLHSASYPSSIAKVERSAFVGNYFINYRKSFFCPLPTTPPFNFAPQSFPPLPPPPPNK